MTVLTTTFKKLIARPTTELGLLLLTLTAFFACGKRDTRFSPEKRRITDSIISSIGTEDSLAQIQKTMEQRGDRLGSIVALRELGRRMRNQSRFDKALKYHFNGLKQAENVHDTLEIVKALNNIGTDYRRLGVLDVAAELPLPGTDDEPRVQRHILAGPEKPSGLAQRTGQHLSDDGQS